MNQNLEQKDISCELRNARYSIEGILKELNQVENNGFLSMEYIDEKLGKIRQDCVRISKLRGFS